MVKCEVIKTNLAKKIKLEKDDVKVGVKTKRFNT